MSNIANIDDQNAIDRSKLTEGEFLRIEDKYLTNGDLKKRVLNSLYENMEPSYLDPQTEFTMIESLYFDSDNLDFFRHHFAKKPTRYKMRIRKYGPDGVWNTDSYLLELKRKSNGKCKKVRFKISPSDLDSLMRGETLQSLEKIYQLNKAVGRKAITQRFNMINDLITEYKLRPVRAIRYKRFAFEKDGFRATVDTELHQIEHINLDQEFSNNIKSEDKTWKKVTKIMNKYGDGNKFVLELKHTGTIPEWTKEMLEKYEIKQTSFSKYCFFTGSQLDRLSSH